MSAEMSEEMSEEARQKIFGEVAHNDFFQSLGVQLLEVRPGYAKSELVLEEKHANPIGSIQGGILFSMVDETAGVACTAYGYGVTTIEGNIHYMNAPLKSKKLITESRVVKRGRNISVTESQIHDETGLYIAKSDMSFFNLWSLKETEDKKTGDK